VTAPRLPLENVAVEIVDWMLSRPASLGTGRLVCVDGPAGSGKTTLGLAIERAVRDRLARPLQPPEHAQVQLLHMDDVYEGWSGLDAAMKRVARDIVGPLRSGEAGSYRRYDWAAETFAEELVVEPVDVLVIEGVGSGAAAYDDAITCLVWVETPADIRLRRGLERDGEQMRDHWLDWRDQEDDVLGRERTRDRADVIIDGTATVARYVDNSR
jgi:uridine kinase